MSSKSKVKKPNLMVIGWIEHIDLPDLDLHNLRTKIDTGARTSALHATHIETFTQGEDPWVSFQVQFEDDALSLSMKAPVYDVRHIKNTSGIPEKRIVIRTPLQIAGRIWPISVSLTDRSNMRFPMIIGRSALKKQNIAVHTRRANLAAMHAAST
ncbi:ATP-dependent zinc protease family protein [Parasulfitobacter algicola]|uniref:ATP-dependent zinc protease n=1 Tax=Parasulfitobacter algicola TaxID=2614809 RepID=A0ABX2IXK4_9RHOB|nr:RimK/LysX family protein [Sulfitobacter algicola]NSX54923.1 ATP-dependent zinc protease [Sulfitobacter algicola]